MDFPELNDKQATIRTLLVAATMLPLVSSLIVLFFGAKVLKKKAAWLTVGVMGVSFVCTLIAWLAFKGLPAEQQVFTWAIPWIPLPGTEAGWLYLGLLCDHLTIILMIMVTLISTLVHLYSVGYMEGDKRFTRFFAYLSLFTFSMLGIITANGVMQLFVFWELVGLTSYLLIGFWFEKKGPQLACKKAFVMNRVGDAGLLIGFGILFSKLGANVLLPAVDKGMFQAIADQLASEGVSFENPPMWLTVAGIGLFFGAIGKSAQFPLHTWLPDAMEGPTPVSSIVHSATMVAAGVYLTGRIYPILTPGAHLFIATIGLVTCVMAALMACVMTDIKKVLAYSTLSQLGYMILGLGCGAWAFAIFHLMTHAFFKCCLFQCSGSVIHAAHHQQDMRYYGGLAKKMPLTALCYGICTLTISGVGIGSFSLLSGFYSKDGIIAGTVAYGEALGGLYNLFWIGPMAVAYITPFYMARSFFLTFFGKPRDQHLYDHAHEAPATMVIPQLVLMLLAIASVPWMLGWFDYITATQGGIEALGVPVMPWDHHGAEHGFHVVHMYLLQGLAGLVMIGVGYAFYGRGLSIGEKLANAPILKQLHAFATNKFYFDTLYDMFFVWLTKVVAKGASGFDAIVIDGLLVNGSAALVARSADAIRWFDEKVVDGIVNGAASAARGWGGILRGMQAGQIRTYVMLMFGGATVATLVVITFVLAMPKP